LIFNKEKIMRKEWLDILEVKSEKEIDNISNTQWTDISQYQQLSEDFIEKFRNKVDWHNISEYQKLSEEFIEKFRNKVYWYNISIYQKLSEPL